MVFCVTVSLVIVLYVFASLFPCHYFLYMFVVILLLATKLLNQHFKEQKFNYYSAFWLYDDYVKWFCCYIINWQTFIQIWYFLSPSVVPSGVPHRYVLGTLVLNILNIFSSPTSKFSCYKLNQLHSNAVKYWVCTRLVYC